MSANTPPKWKPVTQARSSASLSPWNGGASSVEHSTLMIGKNSAFPAGTVQSRTAVPDTLMTPVRNQTGPSCALAPLEQLPPSSKNGFCSTGNENAHCHHFALHSPYVMPYALAFGGMTPGLGFCACTRDT